MIHILQLRKLRSTILHTYDGGSFTLNPLVSHLCQIRDTGKFSTSLCIFFFQAIRLHLVPVSNVVFYVRLKKPRSLRLSQNQTISFSGPYIHLPINAPTAKTFLNRGAIYAPSLQSFCLSQSSFFRFLLLFYKHLFRSSANPSSELNTAGTIKTALLCLLCKTAIPACGED